MSAFRTDSPPTIQLQGWGSSPSRTKWVPYCGIVAQMPFSYIMLLASAKFRMQILFGPHHSLCSSPNSKSIDLDIIGFCFFSVPTAKVQKKTYLVKMLILVTKDVHRWPSSAAGTAQGHAFCPSPEADSPVSVWLLFHDLGLVIDERLSMPGSMLAINIPPQVKSKCVGEARQVNSR